MKRNLLLKTMLLLCALVVGTSTSWADETDVINRTATYSEIGTTASNAWKSFSLTGSSGAQYTINSLGLNNSGSHALQWNKSGYLYATKSGGKLKSITINGTSGKSINVYAANSAYSAKPSGTALTTMSLTGSDVTYNFTGTYEYIALVGGSSGTSINSISIVWSTGSEINAEDVNIASDATSGEIAYTISNPDGSSLAADEKSPGYDWISNVAVDSENKKVTFETTENTGAERSGVIVLTYGSVSKEVTVTQAAATTKYTVTIETPTNGTLVVKRGETAISSGAQIPDGTELTIETTPAENYRLRNWQAVDGSTHTYTASFTYTINASNVTIRANFELIPEHTASFYVNGTKVSEAVVKEDAAITFPTVEDMPGLKFMGWTTTAIDGTQVKAPTPLVTEATMGKSDITYYAVFENLLKAAFISSDITNTPLTSTREWTHTATGAKIKLSAGQRYTDAAPNTFTVTEGTSNYLEVTAPTNANLKKIVVEISGTNYKINNVQSGGSLSTSGTTQTVTFTSNRNAIRCYATSKQIRAKTVDISYISYCTTAPTTSVTITSAGYATFSSDKDLDFSANAGLEIYYASAANSSKVTMTKIPSLKVPANTGVLLKGAAGTYYGTVTSGLTAIDDNLLIATTTTKTATSNNDAYMLANGSNGIGFYPIANGTTLATDKAYINASSLPSEAKALALDFGETTGISNLNVDANANFDANAPMYNLAGQRVTKSYKGVVIVNGKKMLNK